jgi:hypothetical protein
MIPNRHSFLIPLSLIQQMLPGGVNEAEKDNQNSPDECDAHQGNRIGGCGS